MKTLNREVRPYIRHIDNAGTAMTVLFVDHTAELSGGELALLDLVSSFDPARVRPVVLLFAHGLLEQRLLSAGIETHVVPMDGSISSVRKDTIRPGSILFGAVARNTVKQVRTVSRFLASRCIDVVHCNSLKADIIGGLAARLAGVPVIFHVRDRVEAGYLPARVAKLFRMAARAIPNAVVANSQSTLETLRLPASKTSGVIYSGVSDRFLRIEPYTPGSRCSGPRVALIGRISPWKGQDVFLRAARLILDRAPDAQFLIVGSALFEERAYERYVRSLADELNLSSAACFTGFCEDVCELLTGVDIVVHASTRPEPFGQVVAQAMAAARPVVATRGGGVTELVEDGICGLLVPMGDARAMADAVLKLSDDREYAARLARSARERVRSKFTIEVSVAAAEQIYSDLLKRTPCFA